MFLQLLVRSIVLVLEILLEYDVFEFLVRKSLQSPEMLKERGRRCSDDLVKFLASSINACSRERKRQASTYLFAVPTKYNSKSPIVLNNRPPSSPVLYRIVRQYLVNQFRQKTFEFLLVGIFLQVPEHELRDGSVQSILRSRGGDEGVLNKFEFGSNLTDGLGHRRGNVFIVEESFVMANGFPYCTSAVSWRTPTENYL